jgi:hypothetical protein
MRGDSLNKASLFLSLAIKTSLALAFPLVLLALGFYDERELRRIREIWRSLTMTLKRRRLTEVG